MIDGKSEVDSQFNVKMSKLSPKEERDQAVDCGEVAKVNVTTAAISTVMKTKVGADVINIDENPPPSIFKLNVDCFEELFDYLTLQELHSLGQTCTKMHHIIGYFFRQNYKLALFEWCSGGVTYDGEKLNGFIEFIHTLKLIIQNDELEDFARTAPKFKSLKELHLVLYSSCKFECIEELLENIETIKIRTYSNFGEAIGKTFEFLPNLKRLYLGADYCGIFSNCLRQKYPKLEHFQINGPIPTAETLRTFFEQNPTIRSVGIECENIWDCRGWIAESNVKLDELTLEIRDQFNITIDKHIIGFSTFLNLLYERGFYKRLHIKSDFCCDFVEKLAPLLHVTITRILGYPFENINIRELFLEIVFHSNCNFERYTNVMTFERIEFTCTEFDCILPLFSKSKTLKEIKIRGFFDWENFDFEKLMAERKKLIGASKVTFFIPNKIYNKIKWTMKGRTDFELVKIKRVDFVEWFSSNYWQYD